MALTDAEVARCKEALGFNLLTVGADAYISITRIFEGVIQQYTVAAVATTSATAVTASPTAPTPAAITLTSATGFSAGATVIVDVDSRQEQATIQSLSGAVATIQLSKAHSGTYPVILEGSESIIREILTKLRNLSAPGGSFDSAAGGSGIKKVDEIEFFGNESGSAALADMKRLQRYYRNELSSVLGVPNMHDAGGHGASPY